MTPATPSTLPSYPELVRHAGGPVVAVVFGLGPAQGGLAAARGLGRMGVPVLALGEKDSVGFCSRYVSESHVIPDPHREPEEFMRLLLALGRRLRAEGRIPVLLPARDSVVNLLSRHREELREFYACHVPKHEVIRNCSDKEAQLRLARELGLPAPRTFFDSELPALHRALAEEELPFPLILKARRELPAELRKKFRLIIAHNGTQLQQALADTAAHQIPFLVQEVIPGGDDQLYTFGSCMGQNGQVLAAFTGRKLRQQPPKFGVCRVGESQPVESIARDGERLLRALKFYGISQVETKLDARDGQYKLMEVNPRPWAWLALPVEMGVNIPYAFLCDALGVEIPPQPMPARRGLYISLYEDLYWSLKAHDGKPWAHLFQDYDLITEHYYTRDDRQPGLVHFSRCGRALLKAMLNRVLKGLRLRRG